MSEHQTIQNPENVCFNCLQEKEETELNKIHIPTMGYGSSFDNFSTCLNLCPDCIKLTNPEWWKLEKINNEEEYGSYYKYEKEIFEFVNQMPIEGQELFYARYSYGACADYMSGQDWIDYELGILPHEKCKEYSCYSPQEINAYHERFSICQHPVNRIFNNESKGCYCPFGASGKYEQECDVNNSNECYKCQYFTERTTPIREILNKDYKDYEVYYKAKINQDKYKNKFE